MTFMWLQSSSKDWADNHTYGFIVRAPWGRSRRYDSLDPHGLWYLGHFSDFAAASWSNSLKKPCLGGSCFMDWNDTRLLPTESKLKQPTSSCLKHQRSITWEEHLTPSNLAHIFSRFNIGPFRVQTDLILH